MMRKRDVVKVSGLLKSMSHPLRLQIMCELGDGEKSVGEILAAVSTTHANVSQHLNVLRHQGVVKSRKTSNFIMNRIGDRRIADLMKTLEHLFCKNDGGAE